MDSNIDLPNLMEEYGKKGWASFEWPSNRAQYGGVPEASNGRENGNAFGVGWAVHQSRVIAGSTIRRALMSRIGGWPKKRLYSRLNWLALS